MPPDVAGDFTASNSKIKLYCNHCESQLGIFENEWLRLTSSYARPKETGTHVGSNIGSKVQVVPSTTSNKTAEGCTLSDVVCQRCSTTVGQYCKGAPSPEKQYLIGHYFYKLSKVFLKDDATFQHLDPIFGFSGDIPSVPNSHAPSLEPSSTWSQAPVTTNPALRKAYYANGIMPPPRLSRAPVTIDASPAPESLPLSTWDDIPQLGDDGQDFPSANDGGQDTPPSNDDGQNVPTLNNDGQDVPPWNEEGQDIPPLDYDEPPMQEDGQEPHDMAEGEDRVDFSEDESREISCLQRDVQDVQNDSIYDRRLQVIRDQSETTTDPSGLEEGTLALRRVAQQDRKLSKVTDTLEHLRYEMQEIRSLLGGGKSGNFTSSKESRAQGAQNAEMNALRAENEAMKQILRSLPARLQSNDIQGSSRNGESSRTPESTTSKVLGKRKREADVPDGSISFNDDSNDEGLQVPELPIDDVPDNIDQRDAQNASVWRGADEASIDGVDFSDDEEQFNPPLHRETQAGLNVQENSNGRATDRRQTLPADFVAEERRYLISDSEDENFDPRAENKRPFKHKRTRSADRRRAARVQRKTDSLWKKGVPGGGYENGDGWVEQKRHHSGRFGRKVEVGAAPAVYPRGINERLFKDGKQIPTTHKRLARELEYLGLSDWIEKDKSDALYRRTIRVARKHYAFHHGGISSKALCQGKYTKADLEKVGMWDEELFEEINMGEESDLEKLDFPLDPALAKAVEGWKKEAAAAKQRKKQAKAKEAAAAGDPAAKAFLDGLNDTAEMKEPGRLAIGGGSITAQGQPSRLPNNWMARYSAEASAEQNDNDNFNLDSNDLNAQFVTTSEQTDGANMITAANAVSKAASLIANIWPIAPIELTTSHTLQELLAMLDISQKKERNSFLHNLREYFALDYETGARLTIEQQIALTDERLAAYTSLFLHSKVVINGEKPAGPTFWPDRGAKKLKFSRDHDKITSIVLDIFFLQRYNKKRNLRQRETEAKLKSTTQQIPVEQGADISIDLVEDDDGSGMLPELSLLNSNEMGGPAEAENNVESNAYIEEEWHEQVEEADKTTTPDLQTEEELQQEFAEANKTTSSNLRLEDESYQFVDLADLEEEGSSMMLTRFRKNKPYEQTIKPPRKPTSTNSDKENATPIPSGSTSSQEIVKIESDLLGGVFDEEPPPSGNKTYAGVVKRGRGRPRKKMPGKSISAAEKDQLAKEAMEREERMESAGVLM